MFRQIAVDGTSSIRRLLHEIFGPYATAPTRECEQRRVDALVSLLERGELQVVFVAHRQYRSSFVANQPMDAAPALGPEATEKTWFEVKVVDVYGKPVDGAEILFTQGSFREKTTTNGAGIARWKDAEGGSFATVKLAKPQAIRDQLKEKWGSAKPAQGLEGTKISVLAAELAASLVGETPTTLILYKPLTRIRLIGMHFDTNKSFLRPSAMHGIKHVVSVYKAHPNGKLLVLGHTDTTADDAYNLDLSVERAEAVVAYLKDDVAAWEAWFGSGKPKLKRWGDPEITQMISALPCDPTVHSFQQWSNATRGTSLEVDGIAGRQTRKALVEAYMAIDGTSLPKSVSAVVHGCGEFFPRTDEGDEFGKDGVKSAQNRRVEMICFDDEIEPPVPGAKATKGEPQYKQWLAQGTDTVDIGTDSGMPAVHVRVHAPEGTRADLHLCDASGAVLRVLLMDVAEREGDHVTFDVDPYSSPNPLRMSIAYSGPGGLMTVDLPPVTVPSVVA